MEEKVVLSVENLSTLVKKKFLLNHISFSLHEGEILGVIGEKGSGKTSLIKAISNALPVSEGDIYLDGISLDKNKKLQSEINLCLDPPMFFKYQSVKNNLKFMSSLKNHYNKQKTLSSLEQFEMKKRKNSKVIRLNFYEKKKMAIALTFISDARVYIIDEPFKNVDEEFSYKLKKFLRQLAKKGGSVILTSESADNLTDVCDTFLLLSNRTVSSIMPNEDVENFADEENYTFIETPYPNYAGKLLRDEKGLEVKLLNNKVLLTNCDEEECAKLIAFLTEKKIEVKSAGTLTDKTEQIFASLAPNLSQEEDNE